MNNERPGFRSALETMSEHWAASAGIIMALILLALIGGTTLNSLGRDIALSVCFSHHSPAECNPSLRVRTAEEIERLNDSYLRCLTQRAGAGNSSSLCQELYEH